MQNISKSISIQPLAEERPQPLRHLSSIDLGLALSAFLLAAIGLATVHSASSEMVVDYFPRQAGWVGIGFVLLVIAMSIDYHVLLDLSVMMYLAGIVSLIAVFFIGVQRGGAANWIQIGPWQLQPSEFAKLATALFIARYLAGLNMRVLALRQILTTIGIVGLPIVLVAVEPDMGGAAMFMPLVVGMLLVAGVRIRLLVTAAVVALVLGAGLWTFGMHGYQKQRVLTFIYPERDPLGAGYQVRQSKIAVGSGQLTGKGYMQGTQSQLRFLPARHTDFILSVLAEEWGFAGVLTVLSLYALYITSAARIAMRARDRAGIFLVVGLVSVTCFHILYNSAMVVGFVPITGIPLPFLSYGGSFTMVNFISTGIILGVDMRRYVNR
ncbi:MAG TPA: rod shape-determining protein RodA [Thermoanaerobaculia bacterium]|jgi:rod shape determining protein RodA|nr:rod shape-determining protein RodA [Thermoanaerobaculia bacterium]